MSVRGSLVEEIKKIVGAEVAVIEFEDNKDVLERLTIMVKQRRVVRLQQAPSGALRIEYILTVTAPATDPSQSEPMLDDFVPSFLNDLVALSWFGWDDATKTLDGQNLAYDINAWVLASPVGDDLPAHQTKKKKEG